MRLPIATLREGFSKKAGARFLAGEIGSLRLVIVEREDGWIAYLAGESESAGTAKSGKRRAPKAPRRAVPKKRTGTRPLISTPVPDGPGFELNDDLSGLGETR
jgi:hypothetical protein